MSSLSDLEIITSADILNKDISSLADVPALPASELKAKFDALSKLVVIPEVNEIVQRSNELLAMIDDLESIAEIQGLVTAEQIQSWTLAANRAAVLGYNTAGAHNSIYRGKYLGDAVTNSQWNAIGAGTFDDMYIGDYWTINNINWIIAALNYWLGTGNTTECATSHVVIVPGVVIANRIKLNQAASANLSAGYVGTDFYKGTNSNTGKATCKSIIEAAFGSAHILSHQSYLSNAVSNNYVSGSSWYDSTFELMTERMVFGSSIFNNKVNGTNVPYEESIDNAQLPLFALNHSAINIRQDYWLRDIGSTAYASFIDQKGLGTCGYSNRDYTGIRPVFGICA